MHKYFIICVSLTFLQSIVPKSAKSIPNSSQNGQTIQYANRFRNFSIQSETGSAYLTELRIYQDKREHKLAGIVNITKDFHVRSIEVIIHRCSYEISDCENFQRWQFNRNLKEIIYMKNQIWTPLFDHITPKFDIPSVKKNIYRTSDASLDAKAIITWYPESVKYFWRGDVILRDQMDKKAFIMNLEIAVFTFVERTKKNDRGNTRKQRIGEQ